MTNSSAHDKERLARFNVGQWTDKGIGYEAVTDLWHAVIDTERTKDADGDGYAATHEDVTHEDLTAALRLLPRVRSFLDFAEVDILAAWMDRGATWSAIAEELGYSSGDAVRQRYRRLGGTRSWSAGRPAATPSPDSAPVWVDDLVMLAKGTHHFATYHPDAPGGGAWVVSWLPGRRLLPRAQAITAITLATLLGRPGTEAGVDPGQLEVFCRELQISLDDARAAIRGTEDGR